jgi:hypothetical protein
VQEELDEGVRPVWLGQDSILQGRFFNRVLDDLNRPDLHFSRLFLFRPVIARPPVTRLENNLEVILPLRLSRQEPPARYPVSGTLLCHDDYRQRGLHHEPGK